MPIKLSRRKDLVRQSEIRAMTRACLAKEGINLAQGVCDLEVPEAVVTGAKEAIDSGYNIYTASEGLSRLRKAIAAKQQRFYDLDADPKSEILVSLGATGAFYSTASAILDPGDEVILFEPYYGYHRSTLESMGCAVRFVRLREPDWSFDIEQLKAVLTPQTKALLINTPGNPSGKIFSREELELLGDFAETNDLVVFSDEIYEHFVYDGLHHIPPASIPSLRERTVTLSGFSKIFSITGWRLGYAIAPAPVIEIAAHFNDLVYVCPPTPLQMGAAKGLMELPESYYQGVVDDHQKKRDRFCDVLTKIGLTPHVPKGAYYVMADISRLEGKDDMEKAMNLLERTGIASVPGRAFYHDDAGKNMARFCYAKKESVLEEACERLLTL